MHRTILAALVGLAAVSATVAAAALPLPAASAGSTTSIVEKASGCHRGILRDRNGTLTYGWHFHNRACGRVDVPPPGYSNALIYDYVDRSWSSPGTPVCRYRCQFHGPVKHCEQHCR